MPGVTVRLSDRLKTKEWPVLVEVSWSDAKSGEILDVIGVWLSKQAEYPHGGAVARSLPEDTATAVRVEMDFSSTPGGGDGATLLCMLLINEFEFKGRALPEIDLVE